MIEEELLRAEEAPVKVFHGLALLGAGFGHDLQELGLLFLRRQPSERAQVGLLDDFLVRRMHDILPVKATVNGDGSATAQLTSGDWWLRATATLDSGEEIEWRLPLTIRDGDQAIDLSLENAYERRKKF